MAAHTKNPKKTERVLDLLSIGFPNRITLFAAVLSQFPENRMLFGRCAEAQNIAKTILFLQQSRFPSSGTSESMEKARRFFVASAGSIEVVALFLALRIAEIEEEAADTATAAAEQNVSFFAPIGHRLGLQFLSETLADASFSQLYPTDFWTLKTALFAQRESIFLALESAKQKIYAALQQAKIDTIIKSRIKSIASIARKMAEKKRSLHEISDLFALRLIVPTREACFSAKEVVHSLFIWLPERQKDYIATPKENGYQSLHTTVFVERFLVEIQIRTPEMERVAEHGEAAHWLYAEEKSSASAKKHAAWARALRTADGTIARFSDAFADRVFVAMGNQFFDFPKGATVLDAAFALEKKTGHHAVGAVRYGKTISIGKPLRTGDHLEIVKKTRSLPKKSWLEHAKTRRAKRRLYALFALAKGKNG